MNKQEVYNKVRAHLLTQNKRSVRRVKRESFCSYRGTDGLMCAVGCLIPDGQYDPDCEGRNVRDAMVKDMLAGTGIRCWSLLRDLQNIHDNNAPKDWRARLDDIAKDYGLRIES